MVKILLPCMSKIAWGSVGKTITFSRHLKSSYAKHWSKPNNKRSPKQDAQRLRFSCAKLIWANLTSLSRDLWVKFLMPQPWCKNNPFLHTNLGTGYPCRETPNLPGVPYNRKSEWIVGLAKIGITPIGIKTLWI
jgi:hypothetical protein